MPPRTRVPPFRIIPEYYCVCSSNIRVSLPVTDSRRASYSRLASKVRDEGSVYFYELSDKVTGENRRGLLSGVEVSADVAVFFKPHSAKRQRWVALSSVPYTEKGTAHTPL